MEKSIKQKKLFLLDLDGTLYLDFTLFDGTKPFLEAIKKSGGRYLFLTNNSSKGVQSYVDKLCHMGVECQAQDFVTSVHATVEYLNAHYAGKLFYALGTKSFRSQLQEGGVLVTDELCDGIEGLVMGFDTELTFKKLEDACILLKRDIPYIAANMDYVCPTVYGYVPDCGSVALMLKNATGKEPVFIGKPKSGMIDLAIKKTGCTKEQTVFVGDRIYTDIACGKESGIDTVLVLSGEGTVAQAQEQQIFPTWVYKDVGEMAKELSGLH